MKIFFIVALCLPFLLNAQKITSDKTDPFTGIRTITSAIANLRSVAFNPILQVVSTLDVKGDSVIDYKISFVMPDYGTNVQGQDTTTNFYCLLKTEMDSVIRGEYISSAQFFAGNKSYQGYTYVFKAADLNRLKNNACTDIKFIAPNGHQALVEIDNNARDKISKQGKILTEKIKP